MQRFHFDVALGKVRISDDEGTRLPGYEDARHEAVEFASLLCRNKVVRWVPRKGCRVVVQDANRRELFSVPFQP